MSKVEYPSVNLFDPQVQACPYTAYKTLRDEAPLYPHPETDWLVVTRYDDIAEVIRKPDIYAASTDGQGGDGLIKSEKALAIYREKGFPRVQPFTVDDPLHSAYRTIVERSFTASRVKKLEWRVREIIDDLIDRMESPVEFIEHFCLPLPMTVITERLGLPLEDMPQLKYWADMWARPFQQNLDEAGEIEVAEAAVAFQRYLLDWFEVKRRNPKEDILSDVVTARTPEGRPLNDRELAAIGETLVTGGNETTMNAIGLAMKLMIETDGLEQALRQSTNKIRTFVEEALRLESPTQGLWRFARIDTELNGRPIKKGTPIHIRFGAANRDERHFGCPEALDLERRNAGSHMAFNQGAHHCIGAPLARQEMQVSFERLLERCENFAFACSPEDIKYIPGLVIRRLESLPIRFEKRSD